MCRSRSSRIGERKKGHGKISWPNPIGKHIQVLQQNPPESGHDGGQPARQRRAIFGLMHRTIIEKKNSTHLHGTHVPPSTASTTDIRRVSHEVRKSASSGAVREHSARGTERSIAPALAQRFECLLDSEGC
jgi:hypothetical protein